MDSPSQGRWSGPGGPHDEPQPARGQSPRPPKLQLGAAAADGSLHPAETLDQPVLRSTPSGPGRTPHLSDSSDTGVFRASTVTQAGGLRVSLQSSAPAEGAPLCQTLLPACRQLSASFPPQGPPEQLCCCLPARRADSRSAPDVRGQALTLDVKMMTLQPMGCQSSRLPRLH